MIYITLQLLRDSNDIIDVSSTFKIRFYQTPSPTTNDYISKLTKLPVTHPTQDLAETMVESDYDDDQVVESSVEQGWGKTCFEAVK